jgi:hypothetical protein
MRVAAGIPFQATRGAGSHRRGPAASTCGERRRSTSAQGCRMRIGRGKVQEEDGESGGGVREEKRGG